MNITIRKSNHEDLDFLQELEIASFQESQRNSRSGLALALKSTFQEVWIAEKVISNIYVRIGSLILFNYKRSLRVYSLGVMPEYQNLGVGSLLINHACNLAFARQCDKIILEAAYSDKPLNSWYQKKGFIANNIIKDYYKKGEDCLKMSFEITCVKEPLETKNIIVVNSPKQWKYNDINANIISVKEYIQNVTYHDNNSLRVFNLCNSYQYQSSGYYVSLLAAARGQRVIPNATTIRDFKSLDIIRSIVADLDESIQKALKNVKSNALSVNVFLGKQTFLDTKKSHINCINFLKLLYSTSPI